MFIIKDVDGFFEIYKQETNYNFYPTVILVDLQVAEYLIENYNAKIKDSKKEDKLYEIYFTIKKEAEAALEWIESFYIVQKLAGY